MQIINAHTPAHISSVQSLFRQYEASLDTDLCFQSFEAELNALPGEYAPPDGCLLMAEVSGAYAGCVALRRLEAGIGEMKRLYVSPEFRGQSIGIRLIQEVIQRAPNMLYQYIRLDTLPSMHKAISLYESLGFIDITAYRYNPVAGVRYMELDLLKSNQFLSI